MKDKHSNKIYALKQIERLHLSEDEKKVLSHEMKIMQIFNHPNIVSFYDSWEDYETIYHLLEFIEGEDLYEHII